NTMPQWAGSCWYYLRYLDTQNSERFVSKNKEHYWMSKSAKRNSNLNSSNNNENKSRLNYQSGIDLYIGGAEHAVLHLLYSRFWHKVLYDLGHVSTQEPFGSLFNQGYIQAYAY